VKINHGEAHQLHIGPRDWNDSPINGASLGSDYQTACFRLFVIDKHLFASLLWPTASAEMGIVGRLKLAWLARGKLQLQTFLDLLTKADSNIPKP
jgi:hypothetical protein